MVNLKSEKDLIFEMKVREKFCIEHLVERGGIIERDVVIQSHFIERYIGLLGKECRFIVETIATFDNRVS